MSNLSSNLSTAWMEKAIADAYDEAHRRIMARGLRPQLLTPHKKQVAFIESKAKRKIIRAGRRGGKTTGIAILAARSLVNGKRVLYAAPTDEQVETFWNEIMHSFEYDISRKKLYKSETKKYICIPGTKQRIKAKTAWYADMLRGDYADLLILDEFQLMNEDVWEKVGAPMLLDNNGDAVFIYTPPSRRSKAASKASDPMYAAKLFKRAEADETGRWETFHFTSYDNPHLNKEALREIELDISSTTMQQEIYAIDVDDDPNALWRREWIDHNSPKPKTFRQIVIGVDPTGTKSGDECGIVAVGSTIENGQVHLWILADESMHGSSGEWASRAVALYHELGANLIVAESNFGGDMVRHTIQTVEGGRNASIKLVYASRGKAIRAEPVSVAYEKGRGHHCGKFTKLENELCNWVPGNKSPNRLDALVFASVKLMSFSSSSGRGT